MILNEYLDKISKEVIEANLEVIKEKKKIEEKINKLSFEKKVALSIYLENTTDQIFKREFPARIMFSELDDILTSNNESLEKLEKNIKKLLDLGVPKEKLKEVYELIMELSGFRAMKQKRS